MKKLIISMALAMLPWAIPTIATVLQKQIDQPDRVIVTCPVR